MDSDESIAPGADQLFNAKTGGGRVTSFLSSPGGVALIAGITLVVIAAIVTTAVLVARNGGNGGEDHERTVVITDGRPDEDPRREELERAKVVMEEFLELYVSDGWCAGGQYMTADCYEKFCGPEAMSPPPDQGDFSVTDAEVEDYEFLDDDTILFTVRQTDRLYDGSEDDYTREFEMRKEYGAWLVSDCYKLGM